MADDSDFTPDETLRLEQAGDAWPQEPEVSIASQIETAILEMVRGAIKDEPGDDVPIDYVWWCQRIREEHDKLVAADLETRKHLADVAMRLVKMSGMYTVFLASPKAALRDILGAVFHNLRCAEMERADTIRDFKALWEAAKDAVDRGETTEALASTVRSTMRRW